MEETITYVPFGDARIDGEMQDMGWTIVQEEDSTTKTNQYAEANGFLTEAANQSRDGETVCYGTLVYNNEVVDVKILDIKIIYTQAAKKLQAEGWQLIDTTSSKMIYLRPKQKKN